MKNKIFSLCAALVALLMVATSCDDWSPADNKFAANTGGVSLSDLDVNVDEKTNKPQSRASVDVSGFLVTIIDKTTSATAVYNNKECAWTYSEMPEVMTLPVGDYIVNVESHKPAKAEFAKPHYTGSKEFKVEDGKITSIGTVTCTFGSIKVSVRFSDSLKAAMGPDAQAKVVAGEAGGELVWTATETRDGYFEPVAESTTLVATFTGTVKGSQVKVKPREFTNVEKGNYYIITFKLSSGSGMPDETGTIDPSGITIDSTIEEGDEPGDVPGGEEPNDPNGRPDDEEWPDDPTPPGPDEPGPDTPTDDNITFTSETLVLGPDGANSPAVESAVVVISAKEGLANLKVEISSSNADFAASVSELMPMSFDLATVDGETKTNLESIGLPTGEAVVGQTSVNFDISQLVGLLAAFPGKHTFGITVKDSKGNTNATQLIFIAN